MASGGGEGILPESSKQQYPRLRHTGDVRASLGLVRLGPSLLSCTSASQLAWKYGHVKQAKTGLLDAFFAAYAPFEDKGMAFFDWVDNIYDPDEVTRNFQAKGWAVRLTDSILHRE